MCRSKPHLSLVRMCMYKGVELLYDNTHTLHNLIEINLRFFIGECSHAYFSRHQIISYRNKHFYQRSFFWNCEHSNRTDQICTYIHDHQSLFLLLSLLDLRLYIEEAVRSCYFETELFDVCGSFWHVHPTYSSEDKDLVYKNAFFLKAFGNNQYIYLQIDGA